jgi:hypothetical protein
LRDFPPFLLVTNWAFVTVAFSYTIPSAFFT